jgi:hypothetical protein
MRQHTEYAVEYEVDGDTFMYEAEDEDDARRVRAAVDGRLLVRQVFEATWDDIPGGRM